MATKSYNPTANSFELLANTDLQEPSHERRTKAPRKEQEEDLTGARPTPAAKAQARQAAKAKEAAKVTNQANDADFTQTQSTKEQPKQKKLSREQYLEGKKKGIPAVDEEGFAPAGTRRAPRERKENTQGSGHESNGNRGRGNHERGGHRGGRGNHERGGRGGARGPRLPRHEDEGTPSASPAGERSKPPRTREHHGHQAPSHGREYDKKSGMKTGRHAGPKKGGAGGGAGALGTERDDLEAQTGVPEPIENNSTAEQGQETEGWGDAPETGDAATESDKPAEAAEEEPTELSFEAYQKVKAAQIAALMEKVGQAPAPRELEHAERNLSGFTQIRKHEEQTAEQKKETEKKAKADARKGEKALNLGEVFAVQHAAPPGGYSRGGRGGRGRGRGGRGGDRDRGDRGDRGDRDEERGNRGDGERRGGHRGRGDGQRSGGRGRGRGGPRGRGHFDSNSMRQFPDLGSQ